MISENKGIRNRSRGLPKFHWRKILPEVKSVATIDLACKAENIVEKIFWIVFGILGVAWGTYFVGLIIQDDNPRVTINEDVRLTQIDKPAITVCQKGSTKFGIVERLGNLVSKEKIPDVIMDWQMRMILCGTLLNTNGVQSNIAGEHFRAKCPVENQAVYMSKQECKVINTQF